MGAPAPYSHKAAKFFAGGYSHKAAKAFGGAWPVALGESDEPLVDTFILPRRPAVLWPQLATSVVGTWNNITGSFVFGSRSYSSGAVAGADYREWEDVNLFAGPVKIKILGLRAADSGIASVYWGPTKLGEVDMVGSTLANQTFEINGTVGATGRNYIRVISESKTGSSYRLSYQQIEITQPTGSSLGASIDALPWFWDIPPIFATLEYWNGSAWVQHTTSPVQESTAEWGSYVPLGHANNWRATIRFWSPQGSHTLNLRHRNSTAGGTITAVVNGAATTPGTFSTSAGGTSYNNSTSLTFTASTTGMQTLVLSGNGGVACNMQWSSWRKTSALGAIEPTGATYGVESLELYPWFAGAVTGNTTISISTSKLHYASLFNTNDNIGDALQFNLGVNGGTYSIAAIKHVSTGHGEAEFRDNGSLLGTMDWYNPGTIFNVRDSISGSLSSNSVLELVATENAYVNNTLFRLERTGA